MRDLRLRIGLGPIALGLALSLSHCGGGGPTMLAYAEESALVPLDDEPALVSIDDEPALVSIDDEPALVSIDDEPVEDGGYDDSAVDDSADAVDTGRDAEQPKGEGETEQQAEPEKAKGEAEVEPEQVDPLTYEELQEAITPLVDLLMLADATLAVFVGYLAMTSFWGVLGGEQ